MIGIYDNDNVPISDMNLSTAELSDNPFSILVDCRTSYQLAAKNVSGVTISARFAGTGSFQNISISPLDLSPFNGQRRLIDMKIATPDVLEITDGEFLLRVEPF